MSQRQKFISELVPLVQPEVDKIEGSIATTQDNYGKYMHLLTPYERDLRLMVSEACIKAGANAAGVAAALRIL